MCQSHYLGIAVLKSRFFKLEKHYISLKEYEDLIQKLLKKNIYEPFIFNTLKPQERAKRIRVRALFLTKYSCIGMSMGETKTICFLDLMSRFWYNQSRLNKRRAVMIRLNVEIQDSGIAERISLDVATF